jgi:long-chain acyl-CoA synthetase
VAAAPALDPGHEAAPADVVMQLYTSGTTGLPKGVLLTGHNLLSLQPMGEAILGLGPGSVNLVAMPLFHISGSGYALSGFWAGCHTVLVRDVDPDAMLKLICAHQVTHFFVVPAVLRMMLDVPGVRALDLSTLQTIAYGAAPISTSVLTRALATFGCDFLQVYGLSETTGTVTTLTPADHHAALDGRAPGRLRSAGRPVPGAQVRIISPDTGLDVPAGVVGEIWISSPQNTAGYWNNPAETAALLHDGWLRTGDAGYLDEDGYLYIHDRIKDMIISGGENVYPAEVENVLMAHPQVADVAVIGVPSERWGETVKAVVVAAPGAHPAAAELTAFARDRLAAYKCPTSVDFTDALPRNPSGKVLKRELRAPYWHGHDRSVN